MIFANLAHTSKIVKSNFKSEGESKVSLKKKGTKKKKKQKGNY